MALFDASHIDMRDLVEMTIISLPTKKEHRFQDLHGTKNRRQGMSQVGDSKISMQVYRYELFKMKDNETINLVTALRASKDLKKLAMEELLAMLELYEMELRR
ncbi:hypothetical protein CR513_19486, partial [Mucuna pruriens]